MNKTIQKLLNGQEDNHVMPFFWQHGESEAVLRDYMRAIHEANCGAVCVESRPHPDFCGPKWWTDMDVILDEARTRGMKVWILDDSHFPTGYANGAVRNAPDALCRQNVFCNTFLLKQGVDTLNLRKAGLLQPPKRKVSLMEAVLTDKKPARVFAGDRLLSISARRVSDGETIDLSGFVARDELSWQVPEGDWLLRVCVLSRNTGYHRDYINMLDRNSCKLLLDAVYEPHWQHYQSDFGATIAGFFSDEPELGNGFLYAQDNPLGVWQDLPWSAELEERLVAALGEDWNMQLPQLWGDVDDAETARVRFVYMDAVTALVREHFSYQIGNWCREHGVEYIGHVIEDNGQHCRTGSSLGHYFRGLQGQDMAGIDDIGGQVMPQGEDEPKLNQYRRKRNGEFYQYGLAKLAQSAAAIEPRKQQRAMCEIFGNYGWAEGVALEKYLADHFLVRGINYFVPHAFSPKAYPDPDCPPHFYAHGHHPQFRHFGALMCYINRAATLISSGPHTAQAAVLYHGELEWMDSGCMPFEKPLRALYDAQIDCHVLPADVFLTPEPYRADFERALRVNERTYGVLIVPSAKYLTRAIAEALARLRETGVPVFFAGEKPVGLEDGGSMPTCLLDCPALPPNRLAETVRALGISAPTLSPASNRVRVLRVEGKSPVYMLVNEDNAAWRGKIAFPETEACCGYDAWDNRLFRLDQERGTEGTAVTLTLEPRKGLFVVFGEEADQAEALPETSGGEIALSGWKRSLCSSIDYPDFKGEKDVTLPDTLEKEQPKFSGFARYTAAFQLDRVARTVLEIENASEGVEVFVNGVSAGIQIVPPFRYDITGLVRTGENRLAIEVATTLERECYPKLDFLHKLLTRKPSGGSGLTGTVKLFAE